jgi:hypothetical protein
VNTIKFKHNWNGKLDCDLWTTIRRFTPEKFEYYFFLIDKEFDVLVEGISHSYAKLVGIRKTNLVDVQPEILFTDTGSEEPMDVFKKFGLRLDSEVIVLVFKKVKEVV